MSQPRFAPITASLLARKGNAMPSPMVAFAMPATEEMEPQPFVAPSIVMAAPRLPVGGATATHPPEPAHDPARPKKLFVAFSHCEHERLAIAAVKTGLSRHQIVRDALDIYFEQLTRDMGHDCRCVSGGCGSCS